MSFHPIVVSSKTFNETGPGRYTLSTLAISDPSDQFVISAGSRSKNEEISAGVSRILYKNVTDANGKVSKKMCRVSVTYQIPPGFTTAEVDALLVEIDTFTSVANLTRILLGEK